MLHISDLVVRYGSAVALDGVSLEVGRGEMVALVGPNGAGKSTLINTVSGLLTPASGSVVVEGTVAQVPEGRQMFPDMSVEDNLLLGGWSIRNRTPRRGLRPAARPGRDAPAQGGPAVRRTAADGGGRPRPDGAARPAGHRRAVARARAHRGRRARRAPALPQHRAWHRRPPGRAGGRAGLRPVRPRLRAGGGPGRGDRAERRARGERCRAQGLLRRPRRAGAKRRCSDERVRHLPGHRDRPGLLVRADRQRLRRRPPGHPRRQLRPGVARRARRDAVRLAAGRAAAARGGRGGDRRGVRGRRRAGRRHRHRQARHPAADLADRHPRHLDAVLGGHHLAVGPGPRVATRPRRVRDGPRRRGGAAAPAGARRDAGGVRGPRRCSSPAPTSARRSPRARRTPTPRGWSASTYVGWDWSPSGSPGSWAGWPAC